MGRDRRLLTAGHRFESYRRSQSRPESDRSKALTLFLNGIFIALNIRNRVPSKVNVTSLVRLAIRVTYMYWAISLVLGVGGGFYILDLVLVVTLGRTMASCWTLVTALG